MIQRETILIVIVLYEQTLKNSITYESIRDEAMRLDLKFFVYDNSLMPDEDIPSYIHYIHNSTNPGVSKAYNEALKYAEYCKRDWMLLLDQDTKIPVNFFSKLFNIDVPDDVSLCVPRLLHNKMMISPSGYKFSKGFLLKDVPNGLNNLHRKTFLNSGLLIKTSLVRNAGGYDESVPLYFSDFVFINRIRKHIKQFYLMPFELEHNLSSNDSTNEVQFRIRFNFYLKGAWQASRSEPRKRFAYIATTFLRAIKLTYKSKNFYYLKTFFFSLTNHKL
ncbi:glycosyltransferase [Pedobacter sp. HMF7647]|uniref:Glycosyltransferase n=1 Tax=Hufsiella arboris TaxID=2695275 RepID=A0A7K1YC93_9SPHI|nr:glycosyltransferase [Hufsiella arboris]MXV51709.1 glycosyltransferase [Hufsiella arboris]